MVVVMSPDATPADIAAVVARVEGAGGEAFVSRGVVRTIIGLVGDVERFHGLNLRALRGVADVHRISDPYKLVSRQHHRDRSTVYVGASRVPIGPATFTLIAGPCAVETPQQTLAAARMAKAAGATLLRGGAYKPRTSPYAFQGLGAPGLKILADVRESTGLPVVTEIVDAHDIDVIVEHVDMLQIGTRNMSNYTLLQAVGKSGKPVLLKRGMQSTIDEWLMAAEYIAQQGNLDIVLCEGESAPSRRRRATPSTSRLCRSSRRHHTFRSSSTRRTRRGGRTWLCRCRGRRWASGPTGSSSTSTPILSRHCATEPRLCTVASCAPWPRRSASSRR